jgi:hypothetical protein
MVKAEQDLLLFDWKTYYNTYKDIIIRDLEIEVKNRDVAWYHWMNFGKKANLKFFKIDKSAIKSFIDSDPEFVIFDWKQYIKNYPDLEKSINTKKKAWDHWIKHGKKEGRSWLVKDIIEEGVEESDEYKIFDWRTYVNNYQDLRHFKDKKNAWNHWFNHGKLEGRTFQKLDNNNNKNNNSIFAGYSNVNNVNNIDELMKSNWSYFEEQIYKDFCDFDWESYVDNYEDLRDITNKLDAWEHWFFQGRLEGRIFINFNGIDNKYLQTIDIENKCFPERRLVVKDKVNMKTWVDHIYVTCFDFLPTEVETEESKNDYQKLREIKNMNINFYNNSVKRHKNILKMGIFLKNLYSKRASNFMIQYNVPNLNAITNDPKVEFRYFCFRYLDFMRNCFIVPEIELYSKYEAVFIEFREFSHIEFIIRNAIMQLGPNWSYTIVCGNDNYNFMITICNNICKNIKIIKTTFNAVTITEYSDFLKTTDFWNLLIGEKILIYQEDSFIFNNNISEFMEYDYIGAPWIERVLPIRVGNGGLSLRTRQIMIDIIETINNDKSFENEIISEDVFFSKHMQRLKMGKVGDEETASRFSSELIYSKDSFGGHQFWISDPNWKTRMYECMQKILNENLSKTEVIEL